MAAHAPTVQGFTFGAAPAPSTLGTAATTGTTGFSFGTTSAPATASTFTFGQTPPATAVASTSAPATSVPSLFGTTTAAASLTQPTTSSSASPMHYRLLEENVNQWKLELEEHEATFVNQATQVNCLGPSAPGQRREGFGEVGSGPRGQGQARPAASRPRAGLHRRPRRGSCRSYLEPLERGIQATPGLSVQQHADLEREHTYHLAENVNAQLRCMSQDIKDIIQQLNAANAAVAQDKPLNQVSKVLNAHMDALSWVQHNSGLLQKQLQELERACQQRTKKERKNSRNTRLRTGD
uniref:Putative negative regulation of epidermal growth factor receptor signaling pathway n=2 Tax=Ixodes ricinus TaxID=34613 RepID=V5HDV3_IXORI